MTSYKQGAPIPPLPPKKSKWEELLLGACSQELNMDYPWYFKDLDELRLAKIALLTYAQRRGLRFTTRTFKDRLTMVVRRLPQLGAADSEGGIG